MSILTTVLQVKCQKCGKISGVVMAPGRKYYCPVCNNPLNPHNHTVDIELTRAFVRV